VARFLEGHAKVARVLHPGLPSHPQHEIAMTQMEMGGNVVTFDVKGGREATFRFANALQIIKISNNLGDAKSLITHPATTTHQRLSVEQREAVGITEGLVRLSVGLEDPADLIEDLDAALHHA
jgi:O-succinylhomoserine sulfhydrylase